MRFLLIGIILYAFVFANDARRYNRFYGHRADNDLDVEKKLYEMLMSENLEKQQERDDILRGDEDLEDLDDETLLELEALKRFLFKKKTTTAATTVATTPTTTKTTISAGINAIAGFGPSTAKPNVPNLSGGGLDSLMNNLLNKSATAAPTPAPQTPAPQTPAPQTPKPGGSGGLSDLLINLKSSSSSTTTTTTTTTAKAIVTPPASSKSPIVTPSSKYPIVTPAPIPPTPGTPSKFNPCLKNPCQNNGKCAPAANSAGFICVCGTLFTGDLCENMNNCFNNPCQNGGTCHNLRVKYYCSCPKNFQGDNCEKDVSSQKASACKTNPCMNGGTCHQFSFGQYCQCPTTHYGNNCENAFTQPYKPKTPTSPSSNEGACAKNPCKNGARCESLLKGFDYYCHCISPYTGKNCDKNAYGSNSNDKWSNDFYMNYRRDEIDVDNSYEELYARDLLDIQQIRSNEAAFDTDDEVAEQ